MARPTPGRTQFHIWSPGCCRQGLRANVFHFNPGFERDQDYYLDIGFITVGADRWEAVDHHLDLVIDRATHRLGGRRRTARSPPARAGGLRNRRVRRAQRLWSSVNWQRTATTNAWLAAVGMELSWREAYPRHPWEA